MALVAYSDNSDMGSDSEDGEEAFSGGDQKNASEQSASTDPKPEKESLSASTEVQSDDRNGTSTSPRPPKNVITETKTLEGVNSIEDEDEDFVRDGVMSGTSGLFSSVPAAVPVASLLPGEELEEVEDEVVDVPTVDTWKVTQELKKQNNNNNNNNGLTVSPAKASHTAHKKDRKKVKILIPSLSEFADEEEEEVEEAPRRKINPSQSGSGLFSVLPQPKHVSAKEAGRSLVPHVLTKKPAHTKVTKKATKEPLPAKAPAANVSDDDDDDEVSADGSIDFFSLSDVSDTKRDWVTPSLASTQAPAPALPVREEPRVPHIQAEDQPPPPSPPAGAGQHHQHHEEESPSTMVQEPSPSSAAAAAVGIDEAAMLRLAGKRGRIDAINFIDVSADDALLTRQEWMTKALSEEKPDRSFSKKREGLPTQKQKQKHQITYLAHQAKERELELKNTWAENKMTKMQSQAKYGF